MIRSLVTTGGPGPQAFYGTARETPKPERSKWEREQKVEQKDFYTYADGPVFVRIVSVQEREQQADVREVVGQ